MTGAPLPAGTDTVIRIEDTSPGAFGAESVSVELPDGTKPRAAAFVRARGSDVPAGQRALSAGTTLPPAHLGVPAACAAPELTVRTPPRLLLASTGAESVARAAA